MTDDVDRYCEELVTSGDVALDRHFVRMSLFELTMDDFIAENEDELEISDISIIGAFVGLPIWRAARTDIALARNVSGTIGGSRVSVGRDLSVMPGTGRQPAQRVSETSASLQELRRRTELTSRQLRAAERLGSVLIVREDGRREIVRVTDARRRVGRRRFPSLIRPQFLSPGDGDSLLDDQFRALLQDVFHGDDTRMILAFLADPRAGDDHQPALEQYEAVSALSTEEFDNYLGRLRGLPAYDDCAHSLGPGELPRYRIGVATAYRQRMELVGYQRGRLVESVTLGPEESLVTEVRRWDRRVDTREDVRETGRESTLESEVTTTLTTELRQVTEQQLDVGVSGNLGGSLPTEYVGTTINFGASPNVQAALATSMENSVESIDEATQTASETLKQRYQVTTTTRRESGVESTEERTFVNPNRSRSLHLHHYETLARYSVTTRVAEHSQLVLEVPTPDLGSFDRDWIRSHSEFLLDVLRHDLYRDGIRAAQVDAAQEWFALMAAEEAATREQYKRELELQREGQEASSGGDRPKASIFATADRIYDALRVMADRGSLPGALAALADHLTSGNVSPAGVRAAERTIAQSAWWTQFSTAYPEFPGKATRFVHVYETHALHDGTLSSDQERIVVDLVGSLVEQLDDDWLIAVKTIGAGVVVGAITNALAALSGSGYFGAGLIVMPYTMKLLVSPDDAGLMKTLSKARMQHQQISARDDAEALNTQQSPPPVTEMTIADVVPAPPRVYSERELAEAHASLDRLQLHLEANRTHYTNEFYRREDPATRLDRLHLSGIARFVENRILGFSGTRMILPLRLAAFDESERNQLLKLLPDESTIPAESSYEITIPTAGVTTETILGQCEALEPYLVRVRDLDLEERQLRVDALRAQLTEPE